MTCEHCGRKNYDGGVQYRKGEDRVEYCNGCGVKYEKDLKSQGWLKRVRPSLRPWRKRILRATCVEDLPRSVTDRHSSLLTVL